MTIGDAVSIFKKELSAIYDADESLAITNLIFSTVLKKNKSSLLLHSEKKLDEQTTQLLLSYLSRLKKSEPPQYILGETVFCDLTFKINSSVLIPRPETVELVSWIVSENKSPKSILDIGTGSGCIALALKNKFSNAKVYASDISREALQTAKQNADLNDAEIFFIEDDILNPDKKKYPDKFDLLVSNPPYVSKEEKKSLSLNVLKYEPHLALFSLTDPLLFYKSISVFASEKLNVGGKLYFELNPIYAQEISGWVTSAGFENIVLKKDFQQKQRMLCCEWKK